MDNLRSNVVRGSTEGLGKHTIPDALLAHTKVCNLDVSLLVKHDVVQLEVPVDDAVAVEVEDTDGYLCCIKSGRDNSMAELFYLFNLRGYGLLKLAYLLYLKHEVPASNILENKVEMLLEEKNQSDYHQNISKICFTQ